METPAPPCVELFAVQSRVSLDDYASPEAFAARHRALASRVDARRARDSRGRPLHPALAVWPEMLGAPLGVMGHLHRVRHCATAQAAMTRVALAELPGMLGTAVRLVDALGAEVVAQPSANAWAWDGPWAFNEPGESQLRREQWFTEGLFSQLRTLRRVRYAVNPQLVGRFFDNTFEAPSLILERAEDGEVRVLARAGDVRAEDVLQATVPLPARDSGVSLPAVA